VQHVEETALDPTHEAESSEPEGPYVSMHDPGPDLANFPNSSITLKQGGFYFESTPLSYYGSSPGASSQWSLPYLLRYGLVDDVELRLFSNGLTFQGNNLAASPLAFDTKAHLGAYESDLFNASVGIEAYVQSSQFLASTSLKQPLQYSATLLVDHQLPWDLSFGWNVGFLRQMAEGLTRSKPTFQWALQKNLNEDWAVFIQGFHNAATLPSIPVSAYGFKMDHDLDVMGFGAQWIISDRYSVFGNMNFGLTPISPKEIAMVGFAFSL
jgi:hypothetical protein